MPLPFPLFMTHLARLLTGLLLALPCGLTAQNTGTAGIDVFLHFHLPLDGPGEKATLTILRDLGEAVPLHVAADRMLAKFTPEGDIALNTLVNTLQLQGLPLLGVEVMWPGAPVFHAIAAWPDGSYGPVPVAGPDDALRQAAKQAWITAHPDLYDALQRETNP